MLLCFTDQIYTSDTDLSGFSPNFIIKLNVIEKYHKIRHEHLNDIVAANSRKITEWKTSLSVRN